MKYETAVLYVLGRLFPGLRGRAVKNTDMMRFAGWFLVKNRPDCLYLWADEVLA